MLLLFSIIFPLFSLEESKPRGVDLRGRRGVYSYFLLVIAFFSSWRAKKVFSLNLLFKRWPSAEVAYVGVAEVSPGVVEDVDIDDDEVVCEGSAGVAGDFEFVENEGLRCGLKGGLRVVIDADEGDAGWP